MGLLASAFILIYLGSFIRFSQSSTCHAQCDYNSGTAMADCSSLGLDCIPNNYPNAIIMDLRHNNIAVLEPDDFNGTFNVLAELYLDYNSISDVTPLLRSTEMGSLEILSMQHNVLTDLDPRCNLDSLIDLSVDNNLLKARIALPRCDKLCRFSADHNTIDSISFRSLPCDISIQHNKMRYLDIYSFSYQAFCSNLTMRLDHNEIIRIYYEDFWNVGTQVLFLSHNNLGEIYWSGIQLEELDISSNGLRGNLNIFYFRRYQDNFMNNLDISNNSFDSLIQPEWAERLQHLNADSNLLANLSSSTLQGFVNLTELHVAYNRILFVSPSALIQLTMLQYLYLDSNKLTSLLGGIFFSQTDLLELSITNNELTVLHPDYFIGLMSLERLYLSGNRLVNINSEMFARMPGVITLDVSQNELQVFDLEDCDVLTNLRNLTLAHNSLRDITVVLGDCNTIQTLDVSFNRVQVVPADSLAGRNRTLSRLELEGNPLQCDCRLTSLRDWLRYNPSSVPPRCQGPMRHSGVVLTDLVIHEFSCKSPMAMTSVHDLQVEIGQTVSLSCRATGIPTPNITWLHPNGTVISRDFMKGRFVTLDLQGVTLLVTAVQKSDQGVYTCLVENVLDEEDTDAVSVTVSDAMESRSTPMSVRLVVSILPTMCVTIVVTLAVVVAIVCVRRRLRNRDQINSSAHTPNLTVGFRKDRTRREDRQYENQAVDVEFSAPPGGSAIQDDYQMPLGKDQPHNYQELGRRESASNAEVYEVVSVDTLE